MARLNFFLFFITVLFVSPNSNSAVVELNKDNIIAAQSKKLKRYIEDGLVTGGDRAVNDVVVLDVRFAKNQGYERIVLDLEGNLDGRSTQVSRPPYYQVGIHSKLKRLTFTVWGQPKVAFDQNKVAKRFKKSKAVETIGFFPMLEEDRWMFTLNLAKNYEVEVFELQNPVRVILDIRKKRPPSKI